MYSAPANEQQGKSKCIAREIAGKYESFYCFAFFFKCSMFPTFSPNTIYCKKLLGRMNVFFSIKLYKTVNVCIKGIRELNKLILV